MFRQYRIHGLRMTGNTIRALGGGSPQPDVGGDCYHHRAFYSIHKLIQLCYRGLMSELGYAVNKLFLSDLGHGN